MDLAHEELSFEYQHDYTAMIFGVTHALIFLQHLSLYRDNQENSLIFRNTKTVFTRENWVFRSLF